MLKEMNPCTISWTERKHIPSCNCLPCGSKMYDIKECICNTTSKTSWHDKNFGGVWDGDGRAGEGGETEGKEELKGEGKKEERGGGEGEICDWDRRWPRQGWQSQNDTNTKWQSKDWRQTKT